MISSFSNLVNVILCFHAVWGESGGLILSVYNIIISNVLNNLCNKY